MKRAATVDPFGQLPTNRRDTSVPRVELPGTLARVEAAGRGGRGSWTLVDAVHCSSLSFVECDIEGKVCCCDCYAKYPAAEEGREVLIACTPAMVHIDSGNKILRFQAYGIGEGGDYAFVDFALVVADVTSSVNLLASQTGWSWATTQDKERVLICYSAPDGVTPDAT